MSLVMTGGDVMHHMTSSYHRLQI